MMFRPLLRVISAPLRVAAWPAFLLLAQLQPASSDSGRIVPDPVQTFRGRGISLAWEANFLYGGGRQPGQIRDRQLQSEYLDLLFGDPATRLTLGLTIARYNIGGGDDPTHTHMLPAAQMEGFQPGPDAPFDWNRDEPQRHMLHEAQKRGAMIFEAFSVSPPYWMTVSGCTSGSKVVHEDNLRPEMYGRFVNYLVRVVEHFRDVEGIKFESLEPFNEPDGDWWIAGGRQEGYAASYAVQNAIIPALAHKLKREGLETFVSGVDMNNIDDGLAGARKLDPGALSVLGRLNIHDYGANKSGSTHSYPLKLMQYRALARRLHKPVWMSELGCCFKDQGDGTDMWGALFMADAVRTDLRDLASEAWVVWQPDWNIIAFAPDGGAPQPKKQFYALAQYMRFIRPGFQILSTEGAYNTLAAYSPASKRLVLVSTNWDAATTNDFDLGAFEGLPLSVTIYRTTADEAFNLQKDTIALSPKSHLIDQLPTRSVTTYVTMA